MVRSKCFTIIVSHWKLKYGRKETCEVVSWYKSAHVDAELLKPLLNIISDTTEGIEDMKLAIATFSQHLQSIYKQETYYGEPTIEKLIIHSKMLVQEMDQFIKVFLVSDPKIEEMETENNEEKQ